MCQAICIVGNNVWAAHSTGSIVVVSKEVNFHLNLSRREPADLDFFLDLRGGQGD